MEVKNRQAGAVLVTGGSSPLGDVLVPRLVQAGYRVIATARSDIAVSRVVSHGAEAFRLDLDETEGRDSPIVTHVVHAAGIGRAHAAIALCRESSAEHLVAISSASAAASGHPNREWILKGEHELSSSSCDVAILRPTMIYGSPRDRTVRKLTNLLRRVGFAPRLVGGARIMPVLADDVASAVLEAMDRRLVGVWPVAGPEAVRFDHLLATIAQYAGLRRFPLPLPVPLLTRIARAFPAQHNRSMHAVQMLAVDRVVESPIEAGFRFRSTPLDEGVQIALARYDAGSTPSPR